MKFRVMNGKHVIRDDKGNKKVLTRGNLIESDRDLTKLFRNRFELVRTEVVDPSSPTVSLDDMSPPRRDKASVVKKKTEASPVSHAGQDVTNKFKNANGLKILKDDSGYNVCDAETEVVLSNVPMKTRKKVQAWIDENVGVEWDS